VTLPDAVSDVAISKPADVSSRVAIWTISAFDRDVRSDVGSGADSGCCGVQPTKQNRAAITATHLDIRIISSKHREERGGAP
jgi:hypothetical protein